MVKLCELDGVQSVPLPDEFRFEGTEVVIEKQGDGVIIKPKPEARPNFETFDDVARYLQEKFPDAGDFPDIERPTEYDKRDLTW